MIKKSTGILIIILCCLGLILTGCPKKTVVKEEPSSMKREEALKREEAAKREAAERAAREAQEKEAARIREEEARRAKEREKEKEKEMERERQKAFEKSLVAKKEPGISGEILESKLFKDVYFEFDRYDIRPKDTEILRENATLLKNNSALKVQIEGHCDERGTIEYNLALGERRANSTKKYLVSLGISPDRISIISYGKERPLDPGHNEEAWAKNRRAHTIILSK